MRTAVIGLGNRDRGDDAVGLLVADRLAARRPGCDVLAWERPELDLLEVLGGYDRVVLVDAVRSGAPVGTVLVREGVPATDGPGGSHGFGVGAVLRLAASLGRLPADLRLVLVEIGSTDHGAALAPAVDGAADGLVGRLARILEEEGVATPAREPVG